MKKIIFILSVIIIIAGTISTSYSQEPDKKSEKAREKLKAAQKDSINDVFKILKKESEIRFESNEESIAALKVKISNEKRRIKAKDEKKLAIIEQKNIDLKKKLDDFVVEGKDKWMAFKTGFNYDMDELTASIYNLTIKDAK